MLPPPPPPFSANEEQLIRAGLKERGHLSREGTPNVNQFRSSKCVCDKQWGKGKKYDDECVLRR